MNMLIKVDERETRGPMTSSNIRQQPSRGFMDVLTIKTDTYVQFRWILSVLEETAKWDEMTFKLRKYRALVINKWKITKKFQLSI